MVSDFANVICHSDVSVLLILLSVFSVGCVLCSWPFYYIFIDLYNTVYVYHTLKMHCGTSRPLQCDSVFSFGSRGPVRSSSRVSGIFMIDIRKI